MLSWIGHGKSFIIYGPGQLQIISSIHLLVNAWRIHFTVPSVYNTPRYNTDLDVGAPNFYHEFYGGIIGTMKMEW